MSQQINLFNPIFLKQEKHFSARTMVQGLCLILVGGILLTLYVSFQLSTLQTEAEFTTKQLRTAQAQLAKVTAEYGPKQKSIELQKQLKDAESDVAALQRVSEVLQKGEFGNTDGYAEYLRALSRQIVDGVWLTGFSITGAGNEIILTGRATQAEMIPAYISRLKREPALQGKSFAVLEMQSSEVAATAKSTAAGQGAYVDFTLRSSMTGSSELTGVKKQ